MPFGLMNAPPVFQRLMQRLLVGLNPESGRDFVTVYIDDVLVFSPTLDEHIVHLLVVIRRSLSPQSVGLFARKWSIWAIWLPHKVSGPR